MTKFRESKSTFEESMKTVTPCNNWEDLVNIVSKITKHSVEDVSNNLELVFYIDDDRNNWHTYAVILEGWGEVGYTDGN